MTETGRRSLLGALVDRAPRPEIDPALIERTAATHGLDSGSEIGTAPRADPVEAEPASVGAQPDDAGQRTGSPPSSLVLRRERKLKNRSIQFNVRLKPETVDFIYRRANERGVDLADVIEELVSLANR